MSFANLVRKYETTGRIKLTGGQCEGRVETHNEKVSVVTNTPSRGKGSEYAAKFRAEEDKAYFEMMASASQGVSSWRMDVTSNQLSQMEEPEELTSIGTVPNLQELNREDLTQVYKRYNFDPIEPSEHLETIYNEKEQILRLIENNQVCIIKGPTGCGKSTQIPQFILDSYVSRQQHCNIIVTQPRRIAAISIAHRVCQERKWGEPGGIVGYQVGLDKKIEEDTRILYCTTGVLLEKLINTKHLNDYTHIILDEVHEREEDMDFLMLVVKKFLRTNSRNVKVVLMSATIDVTRFANYFEGIIRNVKYPAPYYEIKRESKYSVQVHYLDALSKLGSLPLVNEEEPGISKEAYMLVPMMIRAFNTIDAEDYRCRRSTEKRGAVLIFLPGLHQIETLHEILSNEDKKQKLDRENPDVFNLWLCPLHSSITRDEQEKVGTFAPPDMRKIILSTNIAESSLTIPDVKYVIDFCLTKHLVADPITGFTSLQMAWASHTNCIQREGRVGRVQDGRVYRMVPKNFYQFKMQKEPMPEMLRCPLEIVVLKCKRLMEEECPLRIISNALDPPDLDNYEKTILKLKEVGALLTTCRGKKDSNDGDLTFMGRVMGSLPLDIHISKLILLGHVFDVLEETIIMGCAMSVRNVFSEPFQERLKAYTNKLMWADTSESDAIAYLTAYLVWRDLTACGKFERYKTSELIWGRQYMLQIKHLREISLQEADIKKRLKHFNIQITRYKNKPLWKVMEKPLILKIVLAGAFYPNYYSCSAQNPNAEVEAVKVLGGNSPYRCVYLQNMPQPAPLYFDQVRDYFKENVAQDMELHFDSSQKLIVEFNQTGPVVEKIGDLNLSGEIPGEILMPVYRAIKMRQLNIPMTIRVYHPSEAKDKLNSLILRSRSSLYSICGQSSEYKPAISINDQFVEISVTHVENAGHFYGNIFPSSTEKLRRVHTLLNKQNLLCKLSGEVESSAIYAAPYQDVGEKEVFYYRAKITNKRDNWVDVFFIDYGNSTQSMPVHQLREIVSEEAQKELDKIPPLALECVLAEVAPSLWSKGGRWSEEATAFVKKVLGEKRNWTTLIYSYINGVAAVYLLLEEEGSPEILKERSLNNLLIQEGLAKFKEESYLSKTNHKKRDEVACGEATNSSNEDGHFLKSMKNDLMALPFTNASTRHLKGPHSPLEMKLYSKIKSSTRKEVRVEWNSVNSVLLDSDPTDPHEKLLVSGFVSQSADGRKILVNHTTVLPNMHGLAALVCLMFAPTVELRADDMRSRYIGALCGLGASNRGESLFPENDMEIKFDVEFKNEDLVNVNKVRYFMNQRLCGPDSEDMPEHEIFKIHQNIRALILKLMTPSRQSVKVEHCAKPFRWGLVSENHLLPPFEDTIDAQSLFTSIYQLHFAIDLEPNNDYNYILDLVKKMKNLMSNVQKDIAPRELVCYLCDLDFIYWPLLRQHVTSRHHQQLTKWLKSRATAHGLSLDDSPPRPLPASAPSCASTSHPSMNKPSTSKQSMIKPTSVRK